VEEVMAKKSGGVSSFLFILLVSFFIMTWTINNPVEAKEIYTSVVIGAQTIALAISEALSNA